LLYGAPEQPIKLGIELGFIEGERMPLAGLRDRGERPPAPNPFPQAFDAGRRQIPGPN